MFLSCIVNASLQCRNEYRTNLTRRRPTECTPRCRRPACARPSNRWPWRGQGCSVACCSSPTPECDACNVSLACFPSFPPWFKSSKEKTAKCLSCLYFLLLYISWSGLAPAFLRQHFEFEHFSVRAIISAARLTKKTKTYKQPFDRILTNHEQPVLPGLTVLATNWLSSVETTMNVNAVVFKVVATSKFQSG